MQMGAGGGYTGDSSLVTCFKHCQPFFLEHITTHDIPARKCLMESLTASLKVEHGSVAAQIKSPCEATGFARSCENPALICY